MNGNLVNRRVMKPNRSGTRRLENTGSIGPWSSIASDSTGQYLAAVNGEGGIYTSTNNGSTWSLCPMSSWVLPT